MIAALVKKDFLLLLRNHFVLAIASTLFIMVVLCLNMGIIGYYMMLLAGVLQLLSIVTEVEKKTGAPALLAVTPYTRRSVVAGRYISTMLIYCILTVFYLVVSLALGATGIFPPLTLEAAALGFFLAALFTAVGLPVNLRFRLTTARFLTMLIVLGSMFLLVFVWEMLGGWLYGLFATPAVRCLVCLAGGAALLAASYPVAVRFARRIEEHP